MASVATGSLHLISFSSLKLGILLTGVLPKTLFARRRQIVHMLTLLEQKRPVFARSRACKRILRLPEKVARVTSDSVGSR